MTKEHVRCAIYTRKSSEEGLEQSFNSLEAQREASSAYILSQKHEGWTVLSHRYDDGGFSGGTMERPALIQLLSDVQAGKVDTVVVYKVDRLTRSLTDFSKIIEILDANKVSFVSVTQQFNTTTSMGRLTLNVLLSFAQFEREITGERIRDKIRASKQKGMWMGGFVPLGYDWTDRKLMINPDEAETVREIFEAYLSLGSVSKLKGFLDQKDSRSKVWKSSTGRSYGGVFHSRGSLYHLLNSRIYIGEIVHKEQPHPGQHEPIISRELWNQVAARLQENNRAHRERASRSTSSLLSGRVFDHNGVRLTPTHAVKKGKRYRYYTSQAVVRRAGVKPAISRLPAAGLEKLVKVQIPLLLDAPGKYMNGMEDSPGKDVIAERAADLAKKWFKLEIFRQDEFVRKILSRLTVGQTAVWIEIDQSKFLEALLGKDITILSPASTDQPQMIKITADFEFFRRRGELKIIAPNGKSCFEETAALSLIKPIARARDWYERIIAGEISSIDHLVQKTGLNRRYVRKLLQCANLSPQITEGLLAGKHPPDLTLKGLLDGVLPLDWREQEKLLQLS